MRRRHWIVLALGLLLLGGAVTRYWLPDLVRRVAVARIHAVTKRPVSIGAVDLAVLGGRLTVHDLRVDERDAAAPFVDARRLDLRVHLPALLGGHLWLREVVLSDSTVRVVRLPGGEFNFSDLIQASGRTGRALDVTVERFAVAGGTVSLEDRALPETRTWTSEQITIEARNLSTRRNDGSAVGRSMTAGAPVTVEIKDLRLYPIHLRATVTAEGADLTPLQVYLPPEAPVVMTRGRASTSITLALDAREGLRADATAQLEDLVLARPDGGEALALIPKVTAQVAGFALREGELRLARLGVDGTMSVRDPTARPGARYPLSRLRASVSDLSWPASTPGRLDLLTSVPGGGTLAVTGTLRPPPEATQLHVRLAGMNLAPWTPLLPLAARVSGVAGADLRLNEPLAAGIPARVQGSIAIDRPALADGRQELLGARRIEARGLELHWPDRLVVGRVVVSQPRGVVERDRAGAFPLASLARPAAPAAPPTRASASPALAVEVGEVAVRQGRVLWRDASVSPAAELAVSGVDASVKDLTWPLRGPLDVRAALRPPGGGRVQLAGRVGLDPLTADVRLSAKDAELAPYQPYVPVPARVSGAADLDVAVVVPSLAEGRVTARGSAGLARVDVRDGQRTVARVERATVAGLQLDWPERLSVGRLALTRPWLLVERDREGALPLRTLLVPAPKAATGAPEAPAPDGGPALAVTVAQLSVEDGGIRVVDAAVSPSFALDVQPARLRVDGLSTTGGPARVELTGRVGAAAEQTLRGAVAAFGGPLRVDVRGELREFAVPRTNPYLARQVGWQTREGRLTTTVQCRIDGDALSARTDVRLSRLQLVRASSHDEAQTRIGLPLGLMTTLLKDRRGDIVVSFPVGGRLDDPRFDFREAIWGALRTVAIKTITLPVSWIGRVQFSPDSRIEQIQVDPVAFEPATATLTPAAQEHVARLVAFLDQLPEVRLAATPVVSSGDVEALRRRPLEARIERLAREQALTREDAVARLFAQELPGQPLPDGPEAAVAALLERAPAPDAEAAELAAQRLEVVRAAARRGGIDPRRLVESSPARREEVPGALELEILEPDAARPSRLRDALRRLGLPLKGPGPDD